VIFSLPQRVVVFTAIICGMTTKSELGVLDLVSEAGRLAAEENQQAVVRLYSEWLTTGNAELRHVVLFNLGVAQMALSDSRAAEASFREAIALQPGFFHAHMNLGTLMERIGQPEAALSAWASLTSLDDAAPGEARRFLILALNNSGRLLENLKRYAEAEALLTRSLTLDPEQPSVIHHWVHLRQKQCAWPVYKSFAGISAERMRQATSALAMLDVTDDPQAQLEAARRHVREKVASGLAPLCNALGYGHRRLRLGYLSSNFCMHAVSLLMAEVFELHDRRTFEVFGFCWSPDDGSDLRRRVLSGFDHHLPIGQLSDAEAARLIRSHEIDILIDLQGLTSGARPDILAHRPAPVQMTYLGFPGTTGMPFMDYVLCDRVVLPQDQAGDFTEKPLYMPEVFQVCDRRRPVGDTPSRASCGLPEDALVLCAFNNNHKFTPEMFGAWMRIMHAIPNSVLWLLADNPSVPPHLCQEAQSRGIDPSRLVFAARVMPADYLARYRLADIFLDCFPFNGGTTVNDALWMGLPVVTLSGRSFASRMAGSLLSSLGLQECIAHQLPEYESIAIGLASSLGKRTAIRDRLASARQTAPLFRTDLQVRHMESLLLGLPIARQILPALTPAPTSEILNFRVDTSWGIADPVRFSELMSQATRLVSPGHYLGDNLFVWGRNNSLFEDQAFRKAWEANQLNSADQAIAWRRYILACAAYHCVQLPGDFVECGVYLGSGIKTVMDYIGGPQFPRTFWGYDTFDSNPTSHRFEAQSEGLYEKVCARFADYPQARLIKGLLPDSLEGASPQEISYLHIDLNSAKYEIAVLDALFDRVVPGGIIILDDYEWAGPYREQKIAEDHWFDARRYRVFPLPTGQGIVLKR